jgi:hypothetical protein
VVKKGKSAQKQTFPFSMKVNGNYHTILFSCNSKVEISVLEVFSKSALSFAASQLAHFPAKPTADRHVFSVEFTPLQMFTIASLRLLAHPANNTIKKINSRGFILVG